MAEGTVKLRYSHTAADKFVIGILQRQMATPINLHPLAVVTISAAKLPPMHLHKHHEVIWDVRTATTCDRSYTLSTI